MAHTLMHFEIAANDPAKLSEFYKQLFGWRFEPMPEGMDYIMIDTSEGGQGVNGGMARRMNPEQRSVNYYDVESVDEYTKKVESLGGMVIRPKEAVPSMGWFAVCRDPEGNWFGVWQTDPNAA